MEPKIDLSGITIGGEADNMGGYEYATNNLSLNASDTITLNGLNYPDTVVGGGYISPGYGAVPNVSVSASSYPYTITAGTGINSLWATPSPKIRLDGEGADIEVNGVSLMDMIGKIEQRLNILHPNTELEAEWEELRALGEQYRKLEQHIKDKQATWDRLKAMPPPEID
jgi:hypothetical protein